MAKQLVQWRQGGSWQTASNGALTLTADTLYIKAKGYMPSELVAACEWKVANAGALQSAFLKVVADADAVESITLAGNLDDNDVRYLSTLQTLKSLDMERATVAQGLFGVPFREYDRLATCVLPRS